MIALALRHELRLLRRSPSRILVLAVFLAVSSYAVLAAARWGTTWRETVDSAVQATERDGAKLRGWLAAGEKGPADRPWVDVTRPSFMESYAGTRVGRAPLPLAGICGGVGDDMPVAVRVQTWTDPLGVAGVQIENPEFDRSTGLDLGFVIVILVPLLVGALAFGIGARERESGVARTVAVQAGGAARWALSRAIAATAITLAAVAIVSGLAFAILRPDARTALELVGVVGLYTALWGGLHTLISVACRRQRDAAIGYGLTWGLLCILLPAAASEWALAAVADDYAVDLSLDQRRAQYETYGRDVDSLAEELYEHFPELRQLPAAVAIRMPSSARRQLYAGLNLIALERRHAQRLEREATGRDKARHARWLSPALAARLALERLAGSDAQAAARFRSQLVEAVRGRVRWTLLRTWERERVTVEDFDELSALAPRVVETQRSSLAAHLQILLAWTLLAWLVALLAARRMDRPIG